MSTTHALLGKAEEGWVLEDAGSKNGTLVNGTARKRAVLKDGDIFELGHTLFLFRSAPIDLGEDPDIVDAAADDGHLPGLKTLLPSLARELLRLERLASSDISILVLGETGTGKEMIARAVHTLSQRKGAFMGINCAALPANLVESELFGSKKGAFSGSTEDRVGLVRAADKGTLFLDEVGDLPPPAQAALLRTLQEKEVLAVGATKPVTVDVRVVAATHHDLEGLAERKRFRSDLLARLNGFTLRLPPLRERKEDLGLLVAALLARLPSAEQSTATLAPAAARALLRHDWPLNVRELEKALASAFVLSRGERIELEHLPETVREETRSGASAPPPSLSRPGGSGSYRPPQRATDAVREELVAKLAEHRGNISAVARAMGKARMQIHRWIRQFDLDLEQFRDP
jgi:DNA-binding NtrC family response regulator